MARNVLVAMAVALGVAARWVLRPSPPPAEDPTNATAPAFSEAAVMSAPEPKPVHRPPTVAASALPAPIDESALMTQLRDVRDSDPDRAIALAREGNRRFPDSADAPERTSILIHVLAAQGRSTEARGEAEAEVNRAPDSAWVREIERFTGAHRHRNLRVNEEGALEYVDPPANQAPVTP